MRGTRDRNLTESLSLLRSKSARKIFAPVRAFARVEWIFLKIFLAHALAYGCFSLALTVDNGGLELLKN